MAQDLKVSAKGQITLRKALLKHLGVRPGERVSVDLLPEGGVSLRKGGGRPSLKRLRGLLKRPGRRPASIEEMQESIETEAVDRTEAPR